VTVIEGQVTDVTESAVGKTCAFNGDCIPDKPLSGVQYVCEGSVCTTKPFDDPASQYCLDGGNQLVMRKQPTGSVYGVCLFHNDGECEALSYYYGRCGADTSNLSDCSGYSGGHICTMEYNPVCAKIEVGVQAPYGIVWKTVSNSCVACTTGSRTEVTVGYMMGECPPITTTTLKPIEIINPAAEYCEQQGYVYRIRKYSSGREYGVCVFGLDDECNAEDYFHGKCGPKN
jgi:putative hemolysin